MTFILETLKECFLDSIQLKSVICDMLSITTQNNLDLARHHSAAKMIKILTVLEVLLQDIVNMV